eukprot:3276422-Pleurochrysis_carterae.AAC.2
MADAADRLLAVLVAAGRAAGGGAGVGDSTRTTGGAGRGDTGPIAAPKSLHDLPAGSTSKLSQLRSESGTAMRRAADAAVLQPLSSLEALTAEAMAPAPSGAVAAVALLVAQPTYGGAAWASIFSSGKYTGALPAEGIVPASVVSARQGLAAVLRERIEDVVGEERVSDVADDIARLVESILWADLSLAPAVKLLAGQPPDDAETRAASFSNELCGER